MASSPIYLGVNIDHIATLREARGTIYPDPIQAAILAEEAGADGITLDNDSVVYTTMRVHIS